MFSPASNQIFKFTFGNLFCKLDPNSKYAYMSERELQATMGILYTFITNAEESLLDQIQSGYGFPTGDLGGRTSSGTYYSQHDEDEPLEAYLQIYKLPQEVVESGAVFDTSRAIDMLECFPYSIVCFTDSEGKQTTLRLD